MQQNGLAKLVEECGELIQVAGKMIQYPNLQELPLSHPDGTILRDRIKEEIADVQAAIDFVCVKLNIDRDGKILERRIEKHAKFVQWDNE